MNEYVFLLFPNDGEVKEQFKEYFKKAENYLKSLGLKNIINPVKVEKALSLNHDQYISIDISILSKCKIMYVLRGWQEYKDAVEEVKYASSHNIKCIF